MTLSLSLSLKVLHFLGKSLIWGHKAFFWPLQTVAPMAFFSWIFSGDLSALCRSSTPLIGKTKSTVKVGSWSTVKPPSRRSDNRTLFCQNPQEVAFEEPVKRYSWRDTLTVSLVSLNQTCPFQTTCLQDLLSRQPACKTASGEEGHPKTKPRGVPQKLSS